MTPQAAGSIGEDAATVTCTACPLLCDDIVITAQGVERACGNGAETIQKALAADPRTAAPPAGGWENDRPLARETAITHGAALLTSSRRVLVTGLANATLEAIAAACDLAETLGAAVDAGLPESSRAAGPTIARAGEVTAAWEELRDRAELVVFWCCDPNASHPRFIERFVSPPLADGRRRRTIAVGPADGSPDGPDHRHLTLAEDHCLEAARCLQLILAGRHPPTTIDPRLAAVCVELQAAIRSAGCVAIVTHDGDDPVGLEAWSIVQLVRTIAHERHAFQILLGGGIASGGPNAAGAAAVCAWRYGAAGAIARADRRGATFLPAEADAFRLIDRGEVDAVLVLGAARGPVERVLAARRDAIAVVLVCDALTAVPPSAGRVIQIRCADGLIATPGTMLRGDGRPITLVPCRPVGVRQPAEAAEVPLDQLLALLHDAVRRVSTTTTTETGGRR